MIPSLKQPKDRLSKCTGECGLVHNSIYSPRVLIVSQVLTTRQNKYNSQVQKETGKLCHKVSKELFSKIKEPYISLKGRYWGKKHPEKQIKLR